VRLLARGCTTQRSSCILCLCCYFGLARLHCGPHCCCAALPSFCVRCRSVLRAPGSRTGSAVFERYGSDFPLRSAALYLRTYYAQFRHHLPRRLYPATPAGYRAACRCRTNWFYTGLPYNLLPSTIPARERAGAAAVDACARFAPLLTCSTCQRFYRHLYCIVLPGPLCRAAVPLLYCGSCRLPLTPRISTAGHLRCSVVLALVLVLP